jgi:hemerythrin superfamily protein
VDSISVLLFEHSVIRILSRNPIEYWYTKFNDFNDFVINCHARHEDEIVFPKLIAAYEDEDFRKTVMRVSADHRLIATLGGNISNWLAKGDHELLRTRIPLYLKVLLEHNSSEEQLLFKRWKTGMGSSFRRIIQEFGVSRYMDITGASQQMIESYYD